MSGWVSDFVSLWVSEFMRSKQWTHLQLSVIHSRALLHSNWDMTFHVTQSFIWKTLTWSNWKQILFPSIFQMRKQAYWSKIICLKSAVGCTPAPAFAVPGQFSLCLKSPDCLQCHHTCSPHSKLRGGVGRTERNSGFSVFCIFSHRATGASSPECFSVWFPSLHQSRRCLHVFSDVEEGPGIRQAGFTSQCWLLGHVS